jgi:post-segregation antitoxin (ccd killing protein)
MHTGVLTSEFRRRKASLKIDAALIERASAAGLDACRVAEAALNRALLEVDREKLRQQIAQDMRALEAYVDEHGDPRLEWEQMRDEPDAT